MNNDLAKLETVIGGLYISLIHALSPERAEMALDAVRLHRGFQNRRLRAEVIFRFA
jgi:hypothetical protein